MNSVGCYKSNTFYISCSLYGPQLCLGGVGKNLVEAEFMSVYRRLAANSIQNQVKKRRCLNTFLPGLKVGNSKLFPPRYLNISYEVD